MAEIKFKTSASCDRVGLPLGTMRKETSIISM